MSFNENDTTYFQKLESGLLMEDPVSDMTAPDTVLKGLAHWGRGGTTVGQQQVAEACSHALHLPCVAWVS